MAVELDASNSGSLRIRSSELPPGGVRYFINGTDNDSATAKIIAVAPGVGKKLVLTHLTLGTLAAQSISIFDGATTNLVGPIQLEAAGAIYSKDYEFGIELTTNTEMYVDSDTDGLFHIYAEYMIIPG